MERRGEPPAFSVEPERLVFRPRWSEIQLVNRARQTGGSRWAANARWRIYPLMLALFAGYWWLSVGPGRAWLLGTLLAGIAVAAFLAFPALFSGWSRLPVLHWTIFDPMNLLVRRKFSLDPTGMNVHGWHGDMSLGWEEIDRCDGSAAGLTVHNGLRAWYLPARAFQSKASFETYSSLISSAVSAGQAAAVTASNDGQRFLALGDSYTVGEGVGETERWPEQLAALLTAEGIEMAPPVEVATTGWTTGELAAGIQRAHPRGPYALVSLLIGVNNQYRGLTLDQYREQFRGLLGQAIGFAGGTASRVIVLSIPDWGATAFAEGRNRAQIGREIEAFNAVNREESGNAGSRYVDITAISGETASDRSLTAGDGLHPSGELYRRWAQLILPEARAALRP